MLVDNLVFKHEARLDPFGLIEEEENLSPLGTWVSLMCSVMLHSLDASLAYKLLDAIQANNPPDIIVVVAGYEHIDNLSQLANSCFTPLRSHVLSSQESSINPEQLE